MMVMPHDEGARIVLTNEESISALAEYVKKRIGLKGKDAEYWTKAGLIYVGGTPTFALTVIGLQPNEIEVL